MVYLETKFRLLQILASEPSKMGAGKGYETGIFRKHIDFSHSNKGCCKGPGKHKTCLEAFKRNAGGELSSSQTNLSSSKPVKDVLTSTGSAELGRSAGQHWAQDRSLMAQLWARSHTVLSCSHSLTVPKERPSLRRLLRVNHSNAWG